LLQQNSSFCFKNSTGGRGLFSDGHERNRALLLTGIIGVLFWLLVVIPICSVVPFPPVLQAASSFHKIRSGTRTERSLIAKHCCDARHKKTETSRLVCCKVLSRPWVFSRPLCFSQELLKTPMKLFIEDKRTARCKGRGFSPCPCLRANERSWIYKGVICYSAFL
jgi:hypothetical protein